MSVKEAIDMNGQPNGAANGGSPEMKIDKTRWRMKDDRGRHTWHYLKTDEEARAWPQSVADKYYLGLDVVSSPSRHVHINLPNYQRLTLSISRVYQNSNQHGLLSRPSTTV